MTETVDGVIWRFELNGDEAIIGSDNGSKQAIDPNTTGKVTIPRSLGNHPVTSIGKMAFLDCTSITSVRIPFTVAKIGKGAFAGCTSIAFFDVPLGNEHYASRGGIVFSKDGTAIVAFPAGKKKEEFTIPNDVATIGDWAIAFCPGLRNAAIPDSVTSIGDAAFGCCPNIESFSVTPNNPNFAVCEGVLYSKDQTTLLSYPSGKQGTYEIPPTVTTIKGGAFAGCASLTSVTIPNSVANIADWTFAFCTSLDSVTMPKSVTGIGDSAFKGCASLASLTIPDSVTIIGANAFAGCESLTNLTIGPGVVEIGDCAFCGCKNLLSFSVAEENKCFTAIDGVLFSKDRTTLIAYPAARHGAYEIPSSVSAIRRQAFANCSGLTSVSIPGSVTEFGRWAFMDCEALTSVTFTSMRPSILQIMNPAFKGCDNIASISLCNGDERQLRKIVKGFVYSSDMKTLIEAPKPRKGSVRVPTSVTRIGDNAFSGCNLQSIKIPNSVREIGANAFYRCHSLQSIEGLESVERIGHHAFAFCLGLRKPIRLPDNINEIGRGAFLSCMNIPSVTLPDSMQIVEDKLFENCPHLISVKLPSKVTSIGAQAFKDCCQLRNVTNGRTVKSIGIEAFLSCNRLGEEVIRWIRDVGGDAAAPQLTPAK